MLTRHIRESLQVTPGPFPDFWVGPGDEASKHLGDGLTMDVVKPHPNNVTPLVLR